MICVDANVLIGLLSELVASDGFRVLTVTRAEAMVRPHRTDQVEVANDLLDEFNIETVDVTLDIADRAAALRTAYGNRRFPMVDALVVAFGIESDEEILTNDDKWPEIPEADIRVLST